MNPLAIKFAQQECEIHQQMDHENVVKLYETVETQKEYVMYMEYCDKANQLADKINEVKPPTSF
jgi:serine/threonine protein kinase